MFISHKFQGDADATHLRTTYGEPLFQILAFTYYCPLDELPQWLNGKESACIAGDAGQTLGRKDFLEEEMATHSRFLAGEIPWTEDPGKLQSIWSQRVRYS